MSLDLIKVFTKEKELQKYSDPDRLRNEGIPFNGQLKKHLYDQNKIFLRVEPLAKQGHLLEFKTTDVIFVEELRTITDDRGRGISMHKVWVRKGAVGIKLEAFAVMDLSNAYKSHLES